MMLSIDCNLPSFGERGPLDGTIEVVLRDPCALALSDEDAVANLMLVQTRGGQVGSRFKVPSPGIPGTVWKGKEIPVYVYEVVDRVEDDERLLVQIKYIGFEMQMSWPCDKDIACTEFVTQDSLGTTFVVLATLRCLTGVDSCRPHRIAQMGTFKETPEWMLTPSSNS